MVGFIGWPLGAGVVPEFGAMAWPVEEVTCIPKEAAGMLGAGMGPGVLKYVHPPLVWVSSYLLAHHLAPPRVAW